MFIQALKYVSYRRSGRITKKRRLFILDAE